MDEFGLLSKVNDLLNGFYKDEAKANEEYLDVMGYLYELMGSRKAKIRRFASKARNIISDIAKQEDSHRRKIKQLIREL